MPVERKSIKSIFWNLLLLSAGSIVCAWAIKAILIPQQFLAGGIAGVALLVHYIVPSLAVGLLYFIFNIPLFAIGWMFVGRRFFWFSLAGMAIFSVVMFFPYPVLPLQDELLSALTAGIITGIGSGFIMRSLGSAGGLDILSVILFKKYSLAPGNSVLIFNAALLSFSLLRVPLETILYTLIYLFVSSRVLNIVLIGLSQRKAVMVISPKWQPISNAIMERLQRGVTIVRGEGGFTGQELRLLYSVIGRYQLSRFKEIIREIDPQAIVVVTETSEVMGQGIGNQPHW
jgi:uncharacterized membrane-anchored protein YitT (DUF2179 family)